MSLCTSSHKDFSQLLPLQDIGCNKAEIKNSPAGVISPVPYNCNQSTLTAEHSPLYIPSSFMENRREYSTMAFCSPAMVNYNIGSNFGDAEGVTARQTSSPSALWAAPGHLSPLSLHCQSSLLYPEQPKSLWCEARPMEPVLPGSRSVLLLAFQLAWVLFTASLAQVFSFYIRIKVLVPLKNKTMQKVAPLDTKSLRVCVFVFNVTSKIRGFFQYLLRVLYTNTEHYKYLQCGSSLHCANKSPRQLGTILCNKINSALSD